MEETRYVDLWRNWGKPYQSISSPSLQSWGESIINKDYISFLGNLMQLKNPGEGMMGSGDSFMGVLPMIFSMMMNKKRRN